MDEMVVSMKGWVGVAFVVVCLTCVGEEGASPAGPEGTVVAITGKRFVVDIQRGYVDAKIGSKWVKVGRAGIEAVRKTRRLT